MVYLHQKIEWLIGKVKIHQNIIVSDNKSNNMILNKEVINFNNKIKINKIKDNQ